ncbi:pre-mRNA-splicing factor cwc22 [Tyrophagus putrescentiae]|nr:pre-mRNA-splicing factor cwc22 [Tyrophagus putrescentiae]
MASTSKEDGQKEDIRNKTGGAYLPPAKLRLLQEDITDKDGEAYQRLAWEGLKKRINGLINKVNITNISSMVKKELFAVNLLRGRGLFCRAIIRAQAASPTLTNVYAALVAVCNTKFPKVGELLLKRLIIQFRRTYQRNSDKASCITTARFIAHLVNQNVVYELLALEMLTLLLENATNDSVEVAIAFLKEVGARLEEVAHKATSAIFETLRTILHDGELEKRVQYMIEVAFALRKDKFKDHSPPVLPPELDLVEEAEQTTHSLELLDEHDGEDKLNVFQFDPHFQENEAKYVVIKKGIIGSEESGSDDKSDEEEEEEESGSEDATEIDSTNDSTTTTTLIIDKTEANQSSFRKTVYLTITSSLDVEECAHKLLKLNITAEQAPELAHMIVDCCAQQRSYTPFFGNLGARFCQLNGKVYGGAFEDIFRSAYDTVHRLETEKLRNVAKFFAHLLTADGIRWTVLSHIKLNEGDTTSSSRVFIKILLQELAESLGLPKLNERIKDPTLQSAFEGLFPRDDPAKTRFAVNFFTSIGLGGLTDDLRKHLKTTPTTVNLPQLLGLSKSLANRVAQMEEKSPPSLSSASSSSSSSSSSTSSDKKAQKQKRKQNKHKSSHSSQRHSRKHFESPAPQDRKRRRH